MSVMVVTFYKGLCSKTVCSLRGAVFAVMTPTPFIMTCLVLSHMMFLAHHPTDREVELLQAMNTGTQFMMGMSFYIVLDVSHDTFYHSTLTERVSRNPILMKAFLMILKCPEVAMPLRAYPNQRHGHAEHQARL